jgi:DNA-binding transcriptional MerR regulator
MSIGEVAHSAGLRPSALRYYEGVGLLTPRPQSAGGSWLRRNSRR